MNKNNRELTYNEAKALIAQTYANKLHQKNNFQNNQNLEFSKEFDEKINENKESKNK